MKNDYRCCRSFSAFIPQEDDPNSLEYMRFLEMNRNNLNDYICELDEFGSIIYDHIRKIYWKRLPELEALIQNKYLYVTTVLFIDQDFKKNAHDFPTLSEMLNPVIAKIIVDTSEISKVANLSKQEIETMKDMREIMDAYEFVLKFAQSSLGEHYKPRKYEYFQDQKSSGTSENRIKNCFNDFSTKIFPKLTKYLITSDDESGPSQELLYDTQYVKGIFIRIGRSIEHLNAQVVRSPETSVLLTNFITRCNRWLDNSVKAIKAQFKRIQKDLDKKKRFTDKQFYQRYNHHYEQLILREMTDIRLNICKEYSINYYIGFCAHPEGKSIASAQLDIQEEWYREVFLKYEERLLRVGLSTINELRAGSEEDYSFHNISNTYTGAHRVDENLRLFPPYCTMFERYLKEMKKYHSKNFLKDISVITGLMKTVMSSDPRQAMYENRATDAQEAKRLFEKEIQIARKFFKVDYRFLAVRDLAYEILIKPFEDIFFDDFKTAMLSLNGEIVQAVLSMMHTKEARAKIKTIFHEVLVEAKRKCYFRNGKVNQKELERIYILYNMIVTNHMRISTEYFDELYVVFEEFKPIKGDSTKQESH